MTFAAVIVKLMPVSPDTNLQEIEAKAKELMEKEGAQSISFQENEIAFGLKAIMMKMGWIEAKDTSIIEDSLAKIPNVSSVQIVDYRRAFG